MVLSFNYWIIQSLYLCVLDASSLLDRYFPKLFSHCMRLFLHPRWFPLKPKFSNLDELQFVNVSLLTCFLVWYLKPIVKIRLPKITSIRWWWNTIVFKLRWISFYFLVELPCTGLSEGNGKNGQDFAPDFRQEKVQSFTN